MRCERSQSQASFRDAVLAAYGGRCAISRPPESRAADAAHIVIDADEQLPADRHERVAAIKNPSRRFRRSTDWDRSGLSHPPFREAPRPA
jgi:hypothetical protein